MKISATISIFPYSPTALLRTTGDDAKTFLQGQFTNDLNLIAGAKSVYGLWLDRKGRVIADSQVGAAPGVSEFWIASLSSPAAAIEQHLGGHIIADDVALSDETPAWRGISVVGAGAGDWLASDPRPGFTFPGRRDAGENWEWIFPAAEAEPAAAAVAGARVLTASEIARMRIAAGIPSVPTDIGPADLPNEGGLDRDAISYSKGCYLGQEVMARVKSLGRVRRSLVRVRGEGPLPALPAPLWRGDKREGEIRSGVEDAGGFAGLAMVPVATAAAGDPLALALGADPRVAIVRGA